jgi:hypothetical protein
VAKNAKASTNIFLIMCSCAAKIVGCTVNERLNDRVKTALVRCSEGFKSFDFELAFGPKHGPLQLFFSCGRKSNVFNPLIIAGEKVYFEGRRQVACC